MQDGTDKLRPRRPRKRHNRYIRNKSTDFLTQVSQTDLQDDTAVKDNEYEGEMCMQNGGEAMLCTDITKRLSKNNDLCLGNKNEQRGSAAKKSVNGSSKGIKEEKVGMKHSYVKKDRKPRIRKPRVSAKKESRVKEHINNNELQYTEDASLVNCNGRNESERLGQKFSQNSTEEEKVGLVGDEDVENATGVGDSSQRGKSKQTRSKCIRENNRTIGIESPVKNVHRKEKPRQKCAPKGMNSSLKRSDLTQEAETSQDAGRQDGRKHRHKEENGTVLEGDGKQKNSRNEGQQFLKGIYIEVEGKIILRNVALGREEETARDCTRQHDKRHPRNRRRRRKLEETVGVGSDESSRPQNSGGLMRKHEAREEEGRVLLQNEEHQEKGVLVNSICASKKSPQQTVSKKCGTRKPVPRKQDQKPSQNKSERIEKRDEVLVKKSTLSQRDGSKRKDFEGQQGIRLPKNEFEMNEGLSLNYIPLPFKDRAKGKVDKSQDVHAHDQQRHQENWYEVMNTLEVSSGDNTQLKQTCLLSEAMEEPGWKQSGVMREQQGHLLREIGGNRDEASNESKKLKVEEMPDVAQSKGPKVIVQCQEASSPQSKMPNVVKTGTYNRKQSGSKKSIKKRSKLHKNADNGGVLGEKNVLSPQNDVGIEKSGGHATLREDNSKSVNEDEQGGVGEKKAKENRDTIVQNGNPKKFKSGKAKEATNQRESPSVKVMKDLLDKSPEDIHCFILEHLPVLEKTQNIKDDGVIVLLKLLSKACCCESRIYLDELLRSFQSSWLLNRRVMDLLNKMITGKPKDRNTQSVNLEIIKEILTVVAHCLDRFPKANVTSVLVKLHKATLNLVSSGKPFNKGVIIVLQELMKMKKKAGLEGNREQRRRFPVNGTSTALTRQRRPPENFRELSIVPTAMDIVAVGGYDQGLRKNIVKGSYYNVEHYLDIQFRLLREDFLWPLREGIQLLMATPSDSKDDRLKEVRIYKNARILDPIFTSKGVTYKIKFDVSEFRRLEWENSKRLTYGSLLCLSKDNFKTFVFASVAERMLQYVRRGVIQIRVVSPTSEERLNRGDVYQMVESIAFFEAYRPVLIGLQMISSADFPFKRYIVHVRNDEDVSPPSYLRTGGNKQVLYDFAPIMHSEAKEAISARSNPDPDEGNDQRNEEDSGPKAAVLDLTSWPSAKDLDLDDSQLKALQLALTKEFAIIQGPPGTGKTYVGLKIVQMLLHNRHVWSVNEPGGPILVVCYTNHALDQFLEGILEFHPPCKIIRVGGRSQSEKLKDRCLPILKKEMIKNKLMPKGLSSAFAEIKQEMNEIAALIAYHDKMNEELKGRVFHEAELKEYASSMTSLQYDSLEKCSSYALTESKESIIPEWLGLPVPPMDPYQDGFAKPLAMFPFNADYPRLEYFSQEEIAIVSTNVYPGPGPEGHPQGSLQLTNTYDSFIMIPNLCGDLSVDAEKSITLLAFIYPLRESRLVISYHPDGLGVQLACEFDDEIGKLTASFTRRNLMPAEMPVAANVLKSNEWNFVGASYDFDTGMATLWHNGSVVNRAHLGEGLYMGTQFDIKISVTGSSFSEDKVSVRISHLHIYSEALTSENIKAIGAISHEGSTMTSCSDKQATPERDKAADEEPSDNDDDRAINTDQKWKSPSFRFDADVLEDQRILETDEVIQFNPMPWSDEPNTEATSSGTEMRAEWGSFQYQNARLMRKKIKDKIRKELKKDDVMTKEEAAQVENVWEIADTSDRWRLYRRWVHDACESCHQTIFQFQEMFDEMADELQEVRNQEDYEILKNADVVGMTTTGAAKNRSVLHELKPVITIVEEAAEVFEAHTVTSLTPTCQHLILIGDHQQLRPNPTVYDLQTKFALDVSLFERMVKNGIQFVRLGLQHRMRPEIATLLDHIYVEPRLRNHPSVLEFENVKGVERNLFFLDHTETEDNVKEGSSKSNLHEAKLLTALCRYLIQQGYEREQIAVLTAYSGQLLNVRRQMSKDKDMFEGVRLTAVDSFQGEESDIILLSLVRSKRIGFLKIENRVCVALSRARKGFFIIGNAKLLEEQDTSGLWPKIISNLREQKSLGKHLKLICQIHSKNVIEASKAEDFKNAPEGGCREPCKFKMPDCEHRCPHRCHPVDTEHKEKYACQMPCTRTCDSGHLCAKVCSEVCGPCMVKVPKLIPKCNHEQQVPCSVDPSEFNCKHLVQKQAFPCGHTSLAECSMAPTAIICKEPCRDKLECGHLCEGNCNTCLQGRLHQPCRYPCERILPCGHECVDACVRPCPPCSKTCHICQQKCCYPCRELGGNKKECPHHQHDQCYDEPSKRQECQKRCQEQLSCGHSCIGICGDVCPRLCYVCNAEEFRNSEQDAVFVELTDCGHVFEVNTLDLWIAGSSGEGDEHEIKQKQCPKCKTLILHSVRYEEIVSDLNAVKRQILLSQVVSRIQLQNLREKVKNLILPEMKEHVQIIESSLNNSTGLSFSFVSKCQNQVSFLKSLEKLYMVDNGNRALDLYFLTARIMQDRVCFSSQEIREFTQEITRTTLLVFLECIMADLESRACILSPDNERRVNSAKSVLASGKKIDHQEMELIFADLSKIKQRYSVHVLKDVKLTDSVSELRRDIVMTKHLAQEPWYKCSQGHVYSSVDRNNEGDIKCPTCFAATAMSPKTHRQVLHGGKQLNQKNTMPHRFQLCRPARARQGRWQPFSRFRK